MTVHPAISTRLSSTETLDDYRLRLKLMTHDEFSREVTNVLLDMYNENQQLLREIQQLKALVERLTTQEA